MNYPARTDTARQVSVYVFEPPNFTGFVPWQNVVLAIGGFFIVFTIAHKLFPVTLLVFSVVVALLHFPTGHRPLDYFRYLRQRLPSRPHAVEPIRLEDGATLVEIFGKKKAVVACTGVLSTGAFMYFLNVMNRPVEFVVTNGISAIDSHAAARGVHHLVMVDAADDGEAAASQLMSAARAAGFELVELDQALFQIKAANKIGSVQYLVERLPVVMALGSVASILTATTAPYLAVVRVAHADREAARRRAAKVFPIFEPMLMPVQHRLRGVSPEMASIRQGARDLLDGRTLPFEISIDLSICAREGVELNLARLRFETAWRQAGIALKHVRTRRLPYLSVFREPPVPHEQVVSQGAIVACCPFVITD